MNDRKCKKNNSGHRTPRHWPSRYRAAPALPAAVHVESKDQTPARDGTAGEAGAAAADELETHLATSKLTVRMNGKTLAQAMAELVALFAND